MDGVAQQYRGDGCRDGDAERDGGDCRRHKAAALHQCDGEDERHCCGQQHRDSGARRESKPAGETGAEGELDRRAPQKMRAGEQHHREEEKKQRIGEDLGAEHNECHRHGGKNPGDQSDARGDQSAKRGDKGAGCGVDHRLNERDRAGSVAEYMLDAGEQQRIKRHAVGHRR